MTPLLYKLLTHHRQPALYHIIRTGIKIVTALLPPMGSLLNRVDFMGPLWSVKAESLVCIITLCEVSPTILRLFYGFTAK